MISGGPIGSSPIGGVPFVYALPRQIVDVASLLLQTLVIPSQKTREGELIATVTSTWERLAALIENEPAIMFKLSPRQFEELVAGWYREAGFDEVTLTHRSGDGGIDVIAMKKRGVGEVLYFDSVKRYGPGHLVAADDVRALMGVYAFHPMNATKGIVTTSSDFAPRIMQDEAIARATALGELELVNGVELAKRIGVSIKKS